MSSSGSSFNAAILNAWRGQVAATGKRLGLRTYLLQHRQGLLPRFATLYRQLRALPRQVRKALQRRWGVSLASAALLLTLQPLSGEAATFTASTAADLIAAINEANRNGTTDTITLTADITLIAVDNTAFSSPTGLPVVTSSITIAGQGHTIHRASGAPEFRLLAVSNIGDLTLQDTTLSGGSGFEGGGIYNQGQLTLEGCTVSGNAGGAGGTGGVFSSGSTVVLTNSTISGNGGGGNGAGKGGNGGVDLNGSMVVLTNSTISGNGGGLVYISGGPGEGTFPAAR